MKTDTQISAPSARAVIVNKSDYVHRRLRRRNIKTVSHYEFVLQGDSSTDWHKILLNCPQIRSSTAATATDPLPITSRSSRQYPPPIIRISYIRIFLSIVQLRIPITNSSPRMRFKLKIVVDRWLPGIDREGEGNMAEKPEISLESLGVCSRV